MQSGGGRHRPAFTGQSIQRADAFSFTTVKSDASFVRPFWPGLRYRAKRNNPLYRVLDSAILYWETTGRGAVVDGYTFASEIVKAFTSMIAAFALPSALVACVRLFKEKLAMLVLMFRVRHKDWEASFRWDKAEAEARRLPAIPFDPD